MSLKPKAKRWLNTFLTISFGTIYEAVSGVCVIIQAEPYCNFIVYTNDILQTQQSCDWCSWHMTENDNYEILLCPVDYSTVFWSLNIPKMDFSKPVITNKKMREKGRKG